MSGTKQHQLVNVHQISGTAKAVYFTPQFSESEPELSQHSCVFLIVFLSLVLVHFFFL